MNYWHHQNLSPSYIMGLSLFLVIWSFTWKPFIPWRFTLPPFKIKSLHFNHPLFGTTLPLHWLNLVSLFIMSNNHLLMFLWSPPGLPHVAASLNHPCSEHLRCVTHVLMESVSSPHCFLLQCFIHRHSKFIPLYLYLASNPSSPSLSNPHLSH